MELPFYQKLLLPPLFALIAAALVGLLRRFGTLNRLRLWSVLTGFSAGAYLALSGSGLRHEAVLLQAFLAIATLSAAAAILRLIDLIFWGWFLSKRRHVSVPRLAVDLFKLITIIAVAISVLKFIFGMELSGLLVTSTVVSAVIGLAIQDMLANIAAGLGVQLEKPFTVGDWLLISGHEGVVTQINWRTLTLLTRDRHEILVPNSTVAKTEVINYSRPSSLQRVYTSVGLSYRCPPGEVKAALTYAAQSCAEVVQDPPVEVLLRNFVDSAINYDVRFWITDFGRLLQITDDVNSRIWYELQRRNLTIPYPQRDVHLYTVSPEEEIRAAEKGRQEIFSVLRPLEVFAPLSDDQISTLVSGARLQVFMRGETLVHEGASGESLFVIRSGSVRIDKIHSGRLSTTVAKMKAGDFFGEMSLLTGEPRTASIIAEDETQVVVVSKAAFAPVLAADTAILVALSAALDARSRNTAERLANVSTTGQAARVTPQTSALLRRIGRFFGVEES